MAWGSTRIAPQSGGHSGGASIASSRCAWRARNGSMSSIGWPWRETIVCI